MIQNDTDARKRKDLRNGACGKSAVFNQSNKNKQSNQTPAKKSKPLSIRIVHQELTILRLQNQAMAGW